MAGSGGKVMGFAHLTSASKPGFSNSAPDDLNLYASTASQAVHIGVDPTHDTAGMVLTSCNVTVTKPLQLLGNVTSTATLTASNVSASNVSAQALSASNVSASNVTASNVTASNVAVTRTLNAPLASITALSNQVLTTSNVTVGQSITTPLATINTLSNSTLSTSNIAISSNLAAPLASITVLSNQTLSTSTATVTALTNQTLATSNLTATQTIVTPLATVSTLSNNVLSTSNVTVSSSLTAPFSTILTLSNTTLLTSNVAVGQSVVAPLATITTLSSSNVTVSSNITAPLATITTLSNNTLASSNVAVSQTLTAPLATVTTLSNQTLNASNVMVSQTFTAPVATVTALTTQTLNTSNIAATQTIAAPLITVPTLSNNTLSTSNAVVASNLTAPLASILTLSNQVLATSNITVGSNLTASLSTIGTLSNNTLSTSNVTVAQTLTAPAATVTALTNQTLNTSNITATQTVTAPLAALTTLSNNTLSASNVVISSNLVATLAALTTLSNQALSASNVAISSNLSAPQATITTLSNNTISASNIVLGSNLTAPLAVIAALSNNTLATSNVTVSSNLTAPLATLLTLSNTTISTSNVTVGSNLTVGSTLTVASRVGINTATPVSALDVRGQLTLCNDSGWTSGGIRFRDTVGSMDAAIVQGTNGQLTFRSPAGNGAAGFSWVNSNAAGTIMSLTNAGALSLNTLAASNATVPGTLTACNLVCSNAAITTLSNQTLAASNIAATQSIVTPLLTAVVSSNNTLAASNITASNVVASNLTVNGPVTISGDLTVNGTTTTINANNLNITDNILVINNGQTNPPPSTLTAGLEVNRGGQLSNATLLYTESNRLWKVGTAGGVLNTLATRLEQPQDRSIAFYDATSCNYLHTSNLVWSAAGQLGVNTTSPNYALEVVGSMGATAATIQNISANNIAASNITCCNLTAPSVTTPSSTASNLTACNVTVTNNLVASCNAYVATLSNQVLAASNATIIGQLGFGVAVTPAYTVDVSAGSLGAATICNQTLAASNATIVGQLGVGIGATAPAYTVDASAGTVGASNATVLNTFTACNATASNVIVSGTVVAATASNNTLAASNATVRGTLTASNATVVSTVTASNLKAVARTAGADIVVASFQNTAGFGASVTAEWNASAGGVATSRITSIDDNAGGGHMALYTKSNGTVVERMRIMNGGTVGIGTANPAATLDVNGTVRAASNLTVGATNANSGSSTYVQVLASNAETRLWAFASDGRSYLQHAGDLFVGPIATPTGTARMLVQASTGNVGMGTNTPAYRLEVVGAIGATTASNNTLAASNATVQSTLSACNITAFNAAITTSSNNILAASNATVIGQLGFGTATPAYTIDVSTGSLGAATICNQTLSASNVTVANTLTASNVAASNATVLTTLTACNAAISNAAIGTLSNTTLAASNVTIATTATIGSSATTVTPLSIAASNAVLATIFNPTVSNNGTTQLQLGKSNTTNNAGTITYTHAGGDGSTANTLNLGTVGAQNTLTVSGNGLVGINRTTPAYTLDVNGTLRTTAGILSTNVNANNSMYVGSTGTTSAVMTLVGSNTTSVNSNSDTRLLAHSDGKSYLTHSNDLYIGPTNTTTTPRIYVQNATGNVGVGTSNPESVLNVVGTGTTGANMVAATLTNTAGNPGTGTSLDFRTYASACNANGRVALIDAGNFGGHLAFSTKPLAGTDTNNLTERLRITATGLVGVGTTSPGTTLDINGTLRTSGAASINSTLSVTTSLTTPAATITTITATTITSSNVNTSNATVGTLSNNALAASNATVQSTLTACNITASNISVPSIAATTMTAPTITASNLAASNATIIGQLGVGIGAAAPAYTIDASTGSLGAATICNQTLFTSNATVQTTLTASNVAASNATVGTLSNLTLAASNATVQLTLTASNIAASNATVTAMSNTTLAVAGGATILGALDVGGSNSNNTAAGAIGGMIRLGGLQTDPAITDAMILTQNVSGNQTEMLIYKGNDVEDRVRIRAGTIAFDTSPTSGHTYNSATNIRMIVASNGYVGINTQTPTSFLDVNGTMRAGATGTATSLLLGNSTDTGVNGRFISALDSTLTANNTRFIAFGKSNSTNNQGELSYTHAGDGASSNIVQIGFFGQNNTRFTLMANGNVGIGTSNPGVNLDIVGTARATVSSNNTLAASNITASNVVASNLTVNGPVTISGDLTVNGTTTTINANNLNITDNVLVINNGQTNPPPSTLTAGLEVNRGGTLSNAQLLYTESNQLWKVGLVGGTYNTLATRMDQPQDRSVAFFDATSCNYLHTSNLVWSAVGQLGVGTSNPNPSYQLEVLGTAGATSMVAQTLTASNATVANTLTASNIVASTTATSNATIATLLTACNMLASNAAITTSSNQTLATSNATIATLLTACNVTTCNATITGALRAGTTGTATSLLLGNSADTNGARFISALDSTLAAGGLRYFTFGKSNSTNNQAELTYIHQGDGATSNQLQLGFYNQNFGTRMTLMANGNVGIGTSNPGVTLDVVGTARATTAFASTACNSNLVIQSAAGTSNPLITVWNTSGGGTAQAVIDFRTYSQAATNNPPVARVLANDDNNFGGHLVFMTKLGPSSANAVLERMRITNAGLIGIGTCNPAYTLDVSTGTVAAATASNNALAASNATVQLTLTACNLVNSNATISTLSNSTLAASNATVQSTLTACNIVASNITVPVLTAPTITASNLAASNATIASVLTACNILASNATITGTLSAGAAGTATSLLLGNSTDTGNQGRFLSALDSTMAVGDVRYVTFGKSNSASNQAELTYVHQGDGAGSNKLQLGFANQSLGTRLTITAAGSVGIGTSNPVNASLQLDNGQTNRKLVVWDSGNNDNNQFMGFGVQTNTLRYQIPGTTNAHVFYAATSGTASTELMRIAGNGNVGIGTSVPGATLDIVGSMRASSAVTVGGTFTVSNTIIVGQGNNAGSTSTYLQLYGSNSETRIYSHSDGRTYLQHSNDLFIGGISQTAIPRLLVQASTSNVGIGTASPAYKLDVSGTIRAGTTGTATSLLLGNSADSNASRFLSALDSTMTTNDMRHITFGKSNSGSNQAELTYVHLGDGAASNKLQLGFAGQSTNSRFTITADGRVGISTSNPSAGYALTVGGFAYINILDVAGQTRSLWNGQTTGQYIGSYCNQSAYWALGQDSNLSNFVRFGNCASTGSWSTGYTYANMRMGTLAADSIGVGTCNPAYTLEVAGTVGATTASNNTLAASNATVQLTLTASNIAASNVTAQNTTITGLTASNVTTSNATVATLLTATAATITTLTASNVNASNVSVQNVTVTTSLTSPLDIVTTLSNNTLATSNATVTGTLTASNATVQLTLTACNITASNGTVTTMSNTTLAVSGGAAVLGILDVGGTNSNNATVGAVGGQIRLGGLNDDQPLGYATILTQNVTASDTEMLLFKGNDPTDRIRLRAGTILFDTYSNAVGAYNAAGSNIRMTISSNGNVGIGTQSPGYLLDVAGTIRAGTTGTATSLMLGNSTDSNATRFVSALDSTLASGNTRYIAFGKSNSTNNQAELAYVHQGDGATSNQLQLGFFGQNNGTRFTLLASGKIGIGTSNPLALLDINGSDTTANGIGAAISFQNTASTTSNEWYLRAGAAGNNTPDGGFSIGDCNALRLVLDSNGNVGVGKSNPAYLLDVAGTARTTGTLIVGTTNSTGAQASYIQVLASNAETRLVAYAPDGKSYLQHAGDLYVGAIVPSATPRMYIQASTGYVGINTSNPAYTLDVAGSINFTGTLYQNGAAFSGGGGTFTGTATTITASNTNTSNLYVQNMAGIGTTTPHAPIQTGNYVQNRVVVLYENANDDNQFNGFGVNTNTMRYQVAVTGNSHVFYAGTSSTTSTELMRITGTGNVGIGTSNPNAPLQFANSTANRKVVLYETVNNDHQFYGIGVNVSMLRYQVDGGACHAFFVANSSTASTEVMRIAPGGNVGIGTSNPAYKLDVSGTIRSSTTAAANLLLGTSTDNASTRAISAQDSTMAVNAVKYIQLGHSSTNSNCTEISYTHTGSGSGSNALSFGFYGNATRNMTLLANGNVGVGNTSPSYTLDVSGTMHATNSIYTQSYVQADSYVYAGTYVQSAGSVYAANRLGVGTTGPTFKLDIQGSETTADGGGAAIAIKNTSSTNQWYLRAGATGTNTPNGGLSIGDTSAYRMTFTSTGNVGIGTTAPATTMDVRGQLSLNADSGWNTGGIRFRDTTGNVDAAIVQTTAGYLVFRSPGGANGANGYIWTNANGATNVMTLNNAGYLGIGNNSPGQRLSVAGNDTGSGSGACISLQNTASTNAWYMTAGGPGSVMPNGSFCISDQSRYMLTITSGGNVGINNTNPTATLQVNGSLAKSSGTFDIVHPNPAMAAEGYHLRHSFVESPTRGDNIYRYTVKTADCAASIALPAYFAFLNEDPQVWVSAADVLGMGYGKVNAALNQVDVTVSADGTYNILVIATRKDKDAVQNFDGTGGIEYVPKPIETSPSNM